MYSSTTAILVTVLRSHLSLPVRLSLRLVVPQAVLLLWVTVYPAHVRATGGASRLSTSVVSLLPKLHGPNVTGAC